MPRQIDGVIEAVRYAPDGQIEFVRAYERRGPAFSDRLMLGRQALLERLQDRKRFVTGRRQEYLGGRFETGLPVEWLHSGGQDYIVTTGQPDGRDHLEGVPLL